MSQLCSHCTCFVCVGRGSGPCWLEESQAGVSEVCGATASHLGAPGAITLSATNHHHFPLLKSRRLSSALSVTSGVFSWPPYTGLFFCVDSLTPSGNCCALVVRLLQPAKSSALSGSNCSAEARPALPLWPRATAASHSDVSLRYKLHQNPFFSILMCCLSF